MKHNRIITVMTFLVACISASVFGMDINPPTWRGLPASTAASWEFNADNPLPSPDWEQNPFGQSQTTVYSPHPWLPLWGGMEGVWHLSGLIEIEIPNNPIERSSKLLQIQLTWAGQYPGLIRPVIGIEAERVNGGYVPQQDIVLLSQTNINLGLTNEPGSGQYWNHTTYLYEITPNPLRETIWISGSILVDELVIDTICIPEPATLALLTLSCLAMRYNRRM